MTTFTVDTYFTIVATFGNRYYLSDTGMELSSEFQFDDVSQNLEQHPLKKFRPIENEITVKISTSCQPAFTCSKLTIKVPERRVSIVNSQQVKVFQFAKFR